MVEHITPRQTKKFHVLMLGFQGVVAIEDIATMNLESFDDSQPLL